jgi:hypothetical protein
LEEQLASIPEGANVLYFNDQVDQVLTNTRPELYDGLPVVLALKVSKQGMH